VVGCASHSPDPTPLYSAAKPIYQIAKSQSQKYLGNLKIDFHLFFETLAKPVSCVAGQHCGLTPAVLVGLASALLAGSDHMPYGGQHSNI